TTPRTLRVPDRTFIWFRALRFPVATGVRTFVRACVRTVASVTSLVPLRLATRSACARSTRTLTLTATALLLWVDRGLLGRLRSACPDHRLGGIGEASPHLQVPPLSHSVDLGTAGLDVPLIASAQAHDVSDRAHSQCSHGGLLSVRWSRRGPASGTAPAGPRR